MNYRRYQITAEKHFYTNRGGAKCWLDIYHWGAGLAVTGRIRDNGQTILQSSFETGTSNSPSYFQIFFLITFLEEEAFMRNIIYYELILQIISKLRIYNNAIINNNYASLRDLIWLSKIPTGTR
jgi:hypothetical protein